MLRRLGLSILALAALGLATVTTSAAQEEQGTDVSAMAVPGPQMAGPGGSGADMAHNAMMSGMVRTHHPGDLTWAAPCEGCRVLYDPCQFGGQCAQGPRMWPAGIGLHSTVNRANVMQYFPGGPYSCAAGRLGNPARCMGPAMADMDVAPGGTGSTNMER